MTEIFAVLLIALFSASISRLLEYCFGLADSDQFAPNEIFSVYTFLMAKNRLELSKDVEFLYDVEKLKDTELEKADQTNNPVTRKQVEDNFKINIVERAKELFTWEKAAGMCVYCSNVWLSFVICLFVTIIFKLAAVDAAMLFFIVTAISHFILRTVKT